MKSFHKLFESMLTTSGMPTWGTDDDRVGTSLMVVAPAPAEAAWSRVPQAAASS